MSLLQKLVESYDHMADKYAGLYIDTMREPLAPISHTLQNAQIEITINDEGEFVEAALISKKEGRTLIPVTLKSANRTIKKSPHPFAEQLEFLSGFDTDLQESYLGQLKDWDESACGNKFTHAVYMYVAKNCIIHDLYAVKILESESKADMDKKKLQSTVYKKCLVRWKIKDVLTNEVTDTWKSKEMFQSFISYYNAIITKESKIGLCMITGKNSCPCGYYPMDKCRCTYRQIVKYQNRISGPILDRIDLFVRCEEIGYEALTSNSKEESSADIRKRVSKAWEIQKERFAQSTTLFNGRMNKNEVEIYCKLDEEGQQLMKEAFSVFQLTGRSYFKILKVARTIADLEGSYDIKSRHVEEALYFRQKGEGRVKVR